MLVVIEVIWAKNVERRHLTDGQKAVAGMAFEAFERARAKERQVANLKHVIVPAKRTER